MYAKQIISEQTYTLEEAKLIIDKENAQKREEFIHKAKQKAIGILAIGVSIASLLLVQDATISVFMLPLGIFALYTKEDIIS